MLDGSVNVTMGAFGVTVNRTRIFSSPKPHLTLSMHFAYSKGIPLSSMRRILMPFSYEIWLFIIACIVFMILLLCLNKKTRMLQKNGPNHIKDYEATTFEVMGSFLGLPLTKIALRNNMMLGMVLWLLATLVLRNVYLGSLFNLLTEQFNEDPVDTIERVIEHNYTVYCTPAVYELFYATMPPIRKQ